MVTNFSIYIMLLMDEDGIGNTPSVRIEENVTLVRKLLVQDRHIIVKQLSDETGIDVRSIELILNMHIASAR